MNRMITKKVSHGWRGEVKVGGSTQSGLFQIVELGSDIWNRAKPGRAAERVP
jgi:hypothetical protein